MNYERIYNQLIDKAKKRGILSGYSESHHINKISKKLKGCPSPNRQKVIIEGQLYPSFKNAGEVFNISGSGIRRRVMSKSLKWKDWKRV